MIVSSEVPIYIKYGVLKQHETQMMRVRWKIFTFTYQISENEQVDVRPCGRCFADLILN